MSSEGQKSRSSISYSSEKSFWNSVIGSWSVLYGDIQNLGVSIEWHDFRLSEDLDWAPSFHNQCLEICLNYTGKACFQQGKSETPLADNELAWYLPGTKTVKATRCSNTIHRFFTLEATADFLQSQFSFVMQGLKKPVRQFLENPYKFPSNIDVIPLPSSLLGLRSILLTPPVQSQATDLWYHSKILEILAHALFEEKQPSELFCHKQQRVKRERVERARYLIERDLENPPSLDMLAKEAGCSAYYLSRIFSEETGMSIPKYLRTKRMEKAAELLISGRMNVTEAAMAVGYSSLSSFNKAFVEQMKVCPGLYAVLGNKAT